MGGGYKNLSWDTVTEMQKCISKLLKKDIVDQIKQSKFFAICIDESQDLAVHKKLSVCIRYCVNGEPITCYLSSTKVDDGKAYTITNKFKEVL